MDPHHPKSTAMPYILRYFEVCPHHLPANALSYALLGSLYGR